MFQKYYFAKLVTGLNKGLGKKNHFKQEDGTPYDVYFGLWDEVKDLLLKKKGIIAKSSTDTVSLRPFFRDEFTIFHAHEGKLQHIDKHFFTSAISFSTDQEIDQIFSQIDMSEFEKIPNKNGKRAREDSDLNEIEPVAKIPRLIEDQTISADFELPQDIVTKENSYKLWREQIVYQNLFQAYQKKGEVISASHAEKFIVTKTRADGIKKITTIEWNKETTDISCMQMQKRKINIDNSARGDEKKFLIGVISTSSASGGQYNEINCNDLQKMHHFGKRYCLFHVAHQDQTIVKIDKHKSPIKEISTGHIKLKLKLSI